MLSFTASAKMQSKYRIEATETKRDNTPKVSHYVEAKFASKTEDTEGEWTSVSRRSKKSRSHAKKAVSLVLPTRPSSKVLPIKGWTSEPMPTLPTQRVPKKATLKMPVKTGWAKIAAKTPEMVLDEGKAQLASMQAEMAALKAQIAAAKKASASVDVKKETAMLRNFMDETDPFHDSDGESIAWGDMMVDEYGV